MLAAPWAENRRLSIEQIAETGKMESAGNIGPGDSERGMLHGDQVDAQEVGGREARGHEGSPDASRKAAANGPAASARAKPAPKAKKRLPVATIRALTELEAGELNRYADADEMFRELGHERGHREATRSPGKTASAIGGRIVKPDQANLSPEIARAILKIDFTPEDHRRVDELSAKAQKGTLTPEERAELEEYVRVDLKLTVLRSKARLSLKRANPSP